ncbi:hypothetical protein GGE46_000040 [Rhizobium etli]|uniref:Uncharacterized protein n=1 Tax=Rhizobium etli TaxID=29449 RepID=A0A7W6ZCD3_RHIET|nr:hypothetical protein [Rhizobium etli]MBB4533331.1 hypothetical protein [Rhizobium etli]
MFVVVVVAFWSVVCLVASPLCVVVPPLVPSAGLASCVLLFVPEVVEPPASAPPDLVSVEALPDALPLVEESSFERCSALFCVSEPEDFCCDDWCAPCGQAPEASGVHSVPAALEPYCEPD